MRNLGLKFFLSAAQIVISGSNLYLAEFVELNYVTNLHLLFTLVLLKVHDKQGSNK